MILNQGWLTVFQIQSLITSSAPYLLVGLGEAVVIIAGGIDLSVGYMVSLTCVVVATTSGFVGVPLALIVGALAGLINGILITRFRLSALVTTLATGSFFFGVALHILPTPGGAVAAWISTLAEGNLGPIPIVAFVLGLLLVATWVMFYRTPVGRYLFAVGDNLEGARQSGVDDRRIRIGSYVVAGVLAGLAGIFLAGQTSSGDPNIGTPFTLNAIVVAVLGGTSLAGGIGTIGGVVAASFVLTVISDIIFLTNASSYLQYIVSGGILVVVLGLSQGVRMMRLMSVRAQAGRVNER
jgi:ribose transport system permease protein